MKRFIFLYLLLFLAKLTFAQNDIIRTNPVGNNSVNLSTFNKQTVVDANLKARLTLYIPKGTTPTLNNAKDSVGAIFFKINPAQDTSFYVYHGNNNWIRYAKYSDIINNTWSITGNTGTNPSTNFLGTTDNQDLVFKTNNIEIARLASSGNIGIGTNNPAEKLQVINGNIATNQDVIASFNVYAGDYGIKSDGTIGDIGANGADLKFVNDVGIAAVITGTTSNFGINTLFPTEKLDVGGNVKFSGALMPNNNAGIGGQLLQSTGSGTAPVWVTSGTLSGGTTNYIPKWSSATSLSSTSLLYDDGTNVGIGTTSPNNPLEVSGNISSIGNGNIIADNFGISPFGDIGDIFGINGNDIRFSIYDGATSAYAGAIQSITGNFGIGTITPNDFKLQVAGNIGPEANNTYDLGSASKRLQAAYINTTNTALIGTDTDIDVNFKRNGINAGHLGSGDNSTAFGVEANYGSIGSSSNTVYGRASGYSLSDGDNNTFVGTASGYYVEGGSRNTIIGDNTGHGIVTGSKNTIIGANVLGLPANLNNTVIIADGDGARRIYVDSIGQVGIGTTTPTEKLEVFGNIYTQNELQFKSQDGTGKTTFKTGLQGNVDIDYTLPTEILDDGYVLSTALNGRLTWVNPDLNRAVYNPIQTVTSNYTLTETDHTILVDATGGNITITVPLAANFYTDGRGIEYNIKRMDSSSNTVAISRSGSDLLDNLTTISLTTQYQLRGLQSAGGTQWIIK